jgi:hypothetical protein
VDGGVSCEYPKKKLHIKRSKVNLFIEWNFS